MPYEPRPMIRFDEEDTRDRDDRYEEVPDELQVTASITRRAVVEQSGITYVRCGGGRRRMAKRSN